MIFWHGIPLGVDFRGGTLVYVKYTHTPDYGKIRQLMDQAGLHNARIQRYGDPATNEVLVALDLQETSEQALDRGKNEIIGALEPKDHSKQDLNNASVQSLQEYLLQKDPLRAGTDANQRYSQVAQQIVDYRDRNRGGAISSLDELTPVVGQAVVNSLK